MLAELKVSNYALIEDLELKFSPGLNILSGETGAGKSIIIGAINLLIGDRAAVEQIRQGQERAYIEGIFIPEDILSAALEPLFVSAGLEPADELIIAREVAQGGRSIGRVNGRAVPVSFLKELGQQLIDLHGQHQHQSLLRPEAHLELLDSFGGERISTARARLSDLYQKRQDLKKELLELGENSAERERRIDVAEFQLKEIRDAAAAPGEDEELEEKEKVLANAEKICSLTAQAYADIYAGEEGGSGEAVIDLIGKSLKQISEAALIDQRLNPVLSLLQGASAQLEEVSHELRAYQEKLEYEPNELISIQDRVNQLNTLKRKYGPTLNEVIAFSEKLEFEIEKLKNSEALAEKLENGLLDLENRLIEESSALRDLRREAADKLELLLQESLHELALQNARFTIRITPKESFSPRGMDVVEYLFSANKGEEVKPLAKIISGGEMSRVMLALKTILAREDRLPILVFDEVDSGIGGATVQAVAEKLAQLAAHHQVMCVTHSPQIAAMADNHYCLYKETSGGRTMTRGVKLNQEDKRRELARMMDGASIDTVSLQHVDSLLQRARLYKEQAGSNS